ncbi:MAG: Peptidase M23B [Parcubacteria group bacterium GW2011_GWA2_47_10b]|nr:MAG: Peptidase M23B [Parcubacteria group bacterium GW2011_GWA2_47_10b]
MEDQKGKSKAASKKLLFQKKFLALWLVGATLAAVIHAREAEALSISSFIKSIFGFANDEVVEKQQDVSEAPQKPFPFLSATPLLALEHAEVEIVDNIALVSTVGPLGNVAEAAESSSSYEISTYTVREGDSLGLIAHSFGVSVNTITWANNIPRGGVLTPGQVLVILPVSGVRHTVRAGDTINSIAKKYDGQPRKIVRGGGPEIIGYYARPLSGGRKTQGIHGYNGVDIANPLGSPVFASAPGTVIVARNSGWNGGYGRYIVVAHPNGTQTLYAHLNGLAITAGASVSRGQTIGFVGSSGKSTGPHLHFEIRGAKNPF